MLQNGYQTAAFDNLCGWRAHPKQFVRGYNYYVNPTPQPLGNVERVSAADFNKCMFHWLKGHHKESPFFLFAHYWDPHTPYLQPEPYRTMFHHEPGSRSDLEVKTAKAGYQFVQGWGSVDNMMEGQTRFTRPYYDENDEIVSIDLYDGAIRYLDHHIGRFFQVLKGMGLYDETLIIIVADHGEALGQHGSWGHGSIYEHTIYVPIIMRHPDMPNGGVIQGFVQHADLFPTIVDITDAREWPEFSYWGEEANDDTSLDGLSLLNMASGGDKVRDRMYFEGGGYRGVRSGEWKLIARFAAAKKIGSVELYNMADDPMELMDLSEKRTDLTAELANDLISWVKEKLGPAGKDWAADLSVPWTCEIGKLSRQ
jgi:arylsulfatase A-like enzyme